MRGTKPAKEQTANQGEPPAPAEITGSKAILSGLAAAGVKLFFGYIGGAVIPVYDALYDSELELRHIHTRHEQGAIHAAQGYARATGSTGVCLVTSGPGATNLVTGLADAMMDSTPLVCITGQVGSSLLDSDAFQEQDILAITSPVTKWNVQVTQAADIAPALSRAFRLARSGRPGPVLVDVTKDAQTGTAALPPAGATPAPRRRLGPELDPVLLKRAAAWMDQAERPLLLVGQGVLLAGAQSALRNLAEKTGCPVACSLLGLSAFPATHPLRAGLMGMHGHLAANRLSSRCDLLLAAGVRFGDRTTGLRSGFAKQARIIHIDIDRAEIGKNIPAHLEIPADAREALQTLAKLVRPATRTAWLQELEEGRREEDRLTASAEWTPDGKPGMAEVIREVAARTGPDTLVVTDVGQHQMMTAHHFPFDPAGRLITSGGLGTMGFGLPAALGACAAGSGPVLAFLGDGGLQMTIQELATIRQHHLPVKIVLLNNGYLGMVRQWQELFFQRRYSHTSLLNPDFQILAAGYGIASRRVARRAGLAAAITAMFQENGPFLLEAVVESEENAFPMVPPGKSLDTIQFQA